MLTSLLPGLREIRAPLAAGFTWLTTLWVLLSEPILDATGKDDTLIGRSAFAVSALGTGSLIAGASFVAYIVGSTLLPMSKPPTAFAHWVRRQNPHDWLNLPSRDVGPNDREWLRVQLDRLQKLLYPGVVEEELRHGSVSELVGDLLHRAYDRGWTVPALASCLYTGSPYREPGIIDDFPDPRLEHDNDWGMTVSQERLHAALVEVIDEESEALAINLEIAEPAVFHRFDRLRGEASLRLGLVLPTTVLSIALAISYERWWLCAAFVVPLVMFVQGCRRYFEAEDVIARAIEQKFVTSETLAGLEELADRQPSFTESKDWMSNLPDIESTHDEPTWRDDEGTDQPPYDPDADRHAYHVKPRRLIAVGTLFGLTSVIIPSISQDSTLSGIALVVAWFGVLWTAYVQMLRKVAIQWRPDLGRAIDEYPWAPDWLFHSWAATSLLVGVVSAALPASHLRSHLFTGLVALVCAVALLAATVRSIHRVA